MTKKWYLIALVVGIVILFLAGQKILEEKQTATMEKRPAAVAIVLFQGFNSQEYDAVKKISNNVTIVAADKDIGTKYDVYIGDIKDMDKFISKYKAIVLVGGPGVYQRVTGKIQDPNMEMVIKFVKIANSKGKIIGAICASPAILAKAGILKNKKATVYPSDDLIRILKENGVNYTKSAVVVEGNIITASDPTAAQDFAVAIAKKL
ncbi:ThiJ/PfpI domain protein [Methanothermus fervidus DSM 2088]|uniref:ThiJ/PfpI domain protein n=1 Tax=Methanothermus fervidus (strain ATCC 43054 / DSM 2088 / JCM 10308 / V24 S) TaxID=523846 RepID=E3GWV2_METFV|nr:DJ-1/PfpI family protein [Methanothermus fervidus]ADP78021.1 ThiJ/PfpI domain protein [Methanothermus fervidus DSM 2088]